MNLKISKNKLRFRITKDELFLLQNNKSLQENLALSHTSIAFGIAISEGAETVFEDKNSLLLKVASSDLKTLADNFPSKNGIEIVLENKVLVSLEVDVARKKP
jgi:hypothetical protein